MKVKEVIAELQKLNGELDLLASPMRDATNQHDETVRIDSFFETNFATIRVGSMQTVDGNAAFITYDDRESVVRPFERWSDGSENG